MLVTIQIAKEIILSGEALLIAGDQQLLSQLPKGSWIAGSIPYFIAENGGVFTKDKVFITKLDHRIFLEPEATVYDEESIKNISVNASDLGTTFLIIPFQSPVHLEYAKKAPEFRDMFTKPILGWISGIDLNDYRDNVQATVMNGFTGEVFTDKAVSLHCKVPKGRVAEIGSINIFKQGNGDSIEFLEDSFDIQTALINGVEKNFYQYLLEKKIDRKLPLVGDFFGVMINASFKSIDKINETVHLYAPVFKDMSYKIAAPIDNYIQEFRDAIKELDNKPIIFSCNCILNYLYGELEGKKTGNIIGPITFGEIAYQLVNQTLVYLEVFARPEIV